jgi:hypothetical protein
MSSSVTWRRVGLVRTRLARHHIPEDGILQEGLSLLGKEQESVPYTSVHEVQTASNNRHNFWKHKILLINACVQ